MTKGEIDEYRVAIDDNNNDEGKVWWHVMKPKQASWRGMAKWPILWSFATRWGHELMKMALGLGKDMVPTYIVHEDLKGMELTQVETRIKTQIHWSQTKIVQWEEA